MKIKLTKRTIVIASTFLMINGGFIVGMNLGRMYPPETYFGSWWNVLLAALSALWGYLLSQHEPDYE